MLLPPILIPLCMRFIVVRGILWFSRRQLLPKELRSLEAGWNEEDLKAFRTAEEIIKQRLNTLFAPQYRFKQDIQEILISIQHSRPENEGELRFDFSLRNAAEVALLAFADLYTDLKRRAMLRLLLRLRLKWLIRTSYLLDAFKRLARLPLIRELGRSRLLFGLLRAALIPLVGLPLLIFYLIRSFTLGLVVDGSFRYFYALLMLRITYYGIYLYGGKNQVIASRIASLKKEEILDAGRRLEELLDPAGWEKKSPAYDEAAARLNAVLRDLGVEEDQRLSGGTRRRGRVFRRLRGSLLTAARREFLKGERGSGLRREIYRLHRAVADAYTLESNSLYRLRVDEIAALGYFGALLLLFRLYATPGVRGALGKLSLDFVINIRELSEDELVQNLFAGAREGLRWAGMANRVRRTGKLLRGRYHPVGLALSFAAPVALAHLESSLKGGLYHRIGRLLLYCWEQNEGGEIPPLDHYLIKVIR